MNWGSLANFLQMGGYGSYVWGAYVVATALIVAEIMALRARRRRARDEVTRRSRSGSTER